MRYSYAVIANSIRLPCYFMTVYIGDNKAKAEKAYEDCRYGVELQTWHNGEQISVKSK